MSILIRDMEMPTNCFDCKFRFVTGCCGCLPHNTRLPNCPLQELPPHGRLIDADALRREWLDNGQTVYLYNANDFLFSIDDAQTIIESEGEDGNMQTV